MRRMSRRRKRERPDFHVGCYPGPASRGGHMDETSTEVTPVAGMWLLNGESKRTSNEEQVTPVFALKQANDERGIGPIPLSFGMRRTQ